MKRTEDDEEFVTHDRATLRTWLKLAALGSADEILSAIRSHSAS